jgi:hypothetical protein
MSRIPSIAITAGLLGSGVFAWAFAGRPLLANPDLKAPLNPLGINGSPYGEVFAMAMQSPIDSYFHAGMGQSHNHADGEECSGCADHDHDHDHDHDDHHAGNPSVAETKSPALNVRFRNLLTSLGKASEARTNPKAASEALKRHLRRQAEDKLRFAYQLDPSHYANYNSLHFFLTEPQVGTRPELTWSAAKLAEDTIQYCLKQDNDPRPALTAAAATTNILHLMFEDRRNESPKFNTAQMRQYLGLLDQCIARYDMIAKQWEQSKNWELLSPMRIAECEERLKFICKVREAASGAIDRFEGKQHQPQVSN